MMSKGLIVIFACSAVTFASPIITAKGIIDKINENELKEKQQDNSVKYNFDRLHEELDEVIVSTQEKIFVKIGDRLNSKVFKESMNILQDVFLTIRENIDEFNNVDEEILKNIKEKQDKVAKAFKELMDEALSLYEQGSKDAVNAENFKKAVEELKAVTDTICIGVDSKEELKPKVE